MKELIPATELMSEVMEDFEAIEKARQNIVIQGGDICIHTDEWTYEIPLNECETIAGAINWLFQMEEKTWVTPAMRRRIAELICQHNGQNFFHAL